MDINEFIEGIVTKANIPVAKNVNASAKQTPQAVSNADAIADMVAKLVSRGISVADATAAANALVVCQTVQPSAPVTSLQLNESAKRPELKEFIRDDPQLGKVMRASYYKSKDGYEGYKFYMKPISAFQKEPFGGGWSPNEAQYVEALLEMPAEERAVVVADLKAFNRNPAIAATSRLGKKVTKGILKLE